MPKRGAGSRNVFTRSISPGASPSRKVEVLFSNLWCCSGRCNGSEKSELHQRFRRHLSSGGDILQAVNRVFGDRAYSELDIDSTQIVSFWSLAGAPPARWDVAIHHQGQLFSANTKKVTTWANLLTTGLNFTFVALKTLQLMRTSRPHLDSVVTMRAYLQCSWRSKNRVVTNRYGRNELLFHWAKRVLSLFLNMILSHNIRSTDASIHAQCHRAEGRPCRQRQAGFWWHAILKRHVVRRYCL